MHILNHSHQLDLEKLIDTRLLIQANSGGGKSWALRRILERTHGKVQHLVLDPEGEFATLRERFDYVLAARRGGDTAAEPRIAKLLAERLLELGASAILDLYELKAHERIQFVRYFLEALVDANKKLWHPALVVVDEAHVFCPQQGEAESSGAVIDLCTRGRKRGFAPILATQRLSKLHKDAAAECNNVLIGRTGLDVDVKRAAETLGFGKEMWREMRNLLPGEFFGFGPAISREVLRIQIGEVQTTHPKAGARIAASAPPAPEKVKALLPKLADLPAEAEQRQKTAEDLKRENAQLRRDLAAAQKAQPAPPPAPKEVSVVEDADRVAISELVRVLGTTSQLVRALEERVTKIPVRGFSLPRYKGVEIKFDPPPSTHRAERTPPVRRAESNGALSKGERAMLSALAMYAPGAVAAPRAALIAGYSINSSTFRNILSSLRTQGYAKGDRDGLEITDDGLGALGDYEPLPTGEALRAHWLAWVGESAAPGRVLRALMDSYPSTVDRDALAGRADMSPTSSTYRNSLSTLRTLQLISGRHELRASEDLFG